MHEPTHEGVVMTSDVYDLGALLDAIPGKVWSASAQGQIEYVNQPVLSAIGMSLEAFRQSGWQNIIHPADRDSIVDQWLSSVNTGIPFEAEYRIRLVDGDYRWWHTRATPARSSAGAILRWYGVISDVDDRRRSSDTLLENERQLRLLVDTVPALIWCGTPAGELSYVNQRLLDFIGARNTQLVTWTDLIHPEDLDRVVSTWRRSVDTGESYSDTYRFRRADGIFRRVRSSGEPLRAADGKTISWYGITTDIEDGERLEESLRDAQARLAEAVRRSTVRELSASIAHEINQPLTAIVSAGEACLHWLDAAPPNIERARRSARSIVQDGKSAAKVVDRIRLLFTHAIPVKTTIAVDTVIEEVLRLMDDRLRTGQIQAQWTPDPQCPLVWADRIYLQQILINLIQNAVDSLLSIQNRPKLLRVTVYRPEFELESVAIAVHDNGEGITDLSHIFDSFFTTKENGLGIGLSICRSMVEAHGGRLWASSIPGEGSIFTFTLPIDPGITS